MTGNGSKKKIGIFAIISSLVTVLVVLYAGIVLWTGGWAGIGPALCQKPGTPLIWFFRYKQNQLHAFGNDMQKCTVSFQPQGQNWQPFALSWYRLDNKGICLKSPIVEHIYNFKQGASAIEPSYRLDTLLEKPFYTDMGIDLRQFALSGSYCDDGFDKPGCLIALTPVCVKSPLNAHSLSPAELSMCRQPDIKTRSIVSGHGPVDDIAAIMLTNEKAHGNQGFRYSLVQKRTGLQGGLAIAEARDGRMRCYYRQTQYTHVQFDGNFLATSEASRAQGMAACMAVLADRNRYCPEPPTLPPEVVY